jgi:Tfp pilus assembly protein PilF
LLAALLTLALAGAGVANTKAWYDFREARRSYDAVAYDRADQTIHKSLRFWFWRPSVHIWAARIARARLDFPAAETHLKNARKWGADEDALQLEWLLLRVNRGELDALAAGLWKTVNEGNPQTVYILEALAKQYMRDVRFMEAGYTLTRWLEIEPNNVRALEWRGWVSEQLLSREDASEDYQRALQLDPSRNDVRKRLAYIYLNLGRCQESLQQLEILRRAAPEDDELQVAIASARFQLGQRDEARAILRDLLAKNSTNLAALKLLAKVEELEDRYVEAESLCRRLLVLTPYDMDVHFTLFQSLSKQENREQEAEGEKRIYEQLCAYRKRFDELLPKMGTYNDRPEIMSELGGLYLKVENEQEGLRWLHEALKRDPKHIPTHKILADYYATRDPAKAAVHRRFVEDGP